MYSLALMVTHWSCIGRGEALKVVVEDHCMYGMYTCVRWAWHIFAVSKVAQWTMFFYQLNFPFMFSSVIYQSSN